MATTIAVLVLLAVGTDPSRLDDLRHRAESAFEAGLAAEEGSSARAHFRQAARLYREIRDQGIENVDLYRNLANASLCAHDYPLAILAYRRGLALTPYDSELRNNLSLARARCDGTSLQPVYDWWPMTIAAWPTSPWLLAIDYGLFLVLCALWVGDWTIPKRTAWLITMGCACMALSLALAVRIAREREDRLFPIVIVSEDDILLRKGNGLAYPPQNDVPIFRGAEARLLAERHGWVKIKLESGQTGWAPRNGILR